MASSSERVAACPLWPYKQRSDQRGERVSAASPVRANPAPSLQPGEPAPLFAIRSSNSPRLALQTAAGRYLVLCFYGSAADPQSRAILDLLTTRHRARFDDTFAAFFGVSTDPADENEGRVQQRLPGFRYFWDFDGEISHLYGAGGGSRFTLVLDPLLRVVAKVPFVEPEAHERTVAAVLDGLSPRGEEAGQPIHAPVLILPRVFEPDFCRELIRRYEEQGGSESGYMIEQNGQTIGKIDHSFKRRQDFNFDNGAEFEPLRAAVRSRIGTRLAPEIKKAFSFDATRIERYLVACYDGEVGGHFRPHRDNTTAGTAHRRFAVTINLNAEEFEGGELRFPEFGDKTYRAPTGGAVVFSCSLLHEATPVTRGRRYACLPFLYDHAAAQIRQENRQYLSREIIDMRQSGAA